MKTIKQISFLIALLVFANISFAQDYEIFNMPYEFEDINPNEGGAGTEFMASTSDVVSDPINLGGTFTFYGNDYTQVRVATDGMLTFDLVSSFSTYQYTEIPTSGDNINNLIAMYWNDLSNTSNATYNCHIYQYIDAEKAIFQWDSVRISLYGERITAQMILDYNQNSIQFNYRTFYAANPNDWYNYGVVGIENADGTQGMQLKHNETYADGFELGNGYSYKIYIPTVFPPTLSHCAGVYGEPIDVEINPNPVDANIFYTTDGTTPTTSSTPYTTPISISENTTLKAICEKNGVISEITVADYYFETGGTSICSQDVSGNWTLANSPYYINGDITVPNAQTLTIEAGTEVIFAGEYKLIINGSVNAQGTETDSIKFINYLTDNYWQGIELYETDVANDSSIFNFCVFKNAHATDDDDIDPYDRDGGAFIIWEFDKLRISNSQFDNISAYGWGGAISSWMSDIKVTDCNFTNNYTGWGGACLYSQGGDIIVSGNEMTNNSAGYFGAGIYVTGGSHVITNNNISNNELLELTGRGCGIFSLDAGGKIINNNISYNHAPQGGGGMSISNPVDMLIEFNEINNNWSSDNGITKKEKEIKDNTLQIFPSKDKKTPKVYADRSKSGYGDGGGVDIYGTGTGVFKNNYIHDNYSYSHGGGIFLSADIDFTNNLIENNHARECGGGIMMPIFDALFSNNTIIFNSCEDSGDALCIYGESHPDIYNSVFAYNTGDGYFSSIYVLDGLGAMPNFYNCVLPYGEYETSFAIGNFTGEFVNNHEFFPSFEYTDNKLTGLKNYSPLINNGTTENINLPATDFFGNPRINDGTVDIGCIEFQEDFTANVLQGNQTGTIASGTYYVQSELTIPEGETLTIEAGTELFFCGNFGITNNGTLQALGTSDQHITITVADTTGFNSMKPFIYGGINHIHLDNSNQDKIEYVDFSYSKVNNLLKWYYSGTSNLYGGFIYAYNSSPEIKNCTFENSYSFANGGAVAWHDSEEDGGIFQNNIVNNCKSVLFTYSASALGGDGGALYILNSSPDITGNLIYNNSATYYAGGQPKAGGIMLTNSHSNVLNNTVVNNFSYNGGGFCIYEAEGVTMLNDIKLYNNIVWENICDYGPQFYIAASNNTDFFNNDIDGGFSDIYFPNGVTFNGEYTDNINQNPLFANANNNDFSIENNSPCKNNGFEDMTSFNIPNFDIVGNQRIIENIIDMGAYENQFVTSVENLEAEQFSIYPNPSTGIFTINLQASERPCSVSITDITGKFIYKQQSVIPNSQFSIKEKGIYFINIQTEKSIYSQKLIIQ